MVVNHTWLIDKSALVRLATASDTTVWLERIERGLVSISTVTRLEIGFSARSATDLDSLLASPVIAAMPVAYATPAIEDRAVHVQRALSRRGLHRAPSVPDLLIAATAEIAGHAVLHLDNDFELIAEITGQRVERLQLASA